jgi:trehalose 6-phosphate synthase
MENIHGFWVAASLTPYDAEVAGQYAENIVPIPLKNPKFYLPFLIFDSDVYHKYYDDISNSVLWYTQHYIWKKPETFKEEEYLSRAWIEGYIPVNKAYASKINDLIVPDKQNIVMLQDYHLYLAASYIRKTHPNLILTQFIHIPWPKAKYLSILPEYMRQPIIESLLANDIVGFHIPRYATNFLDSCIEIADKVDYQNNVVYYKDRTIHVKSYPISIDMDSLNQLSEHSDVFNYERYIEKLRGDSFLIYRTDRADLSKNILRGYQAYEMFLEKHPEYHGKVVFLATGKSTRSNLKDYQDYRKSIEELILDINQKYSTENWRPIEEIFEAPYKLVVAALKNYDCLMVNPLCDGMNVVSKEGPFLNQNNGVLILSEEAGSHVELKDQVLSINPLDVDETAEAIHRAVTMNEEERTSKCRGLKELIQKNTLSDWISNQFRDIQMVIDDRL